MRENNNQMSPLQPLPDLTLSASFQHFISSSARSNSVSRLSLEVCSNCGDDFVDVCCVVGDCEEQEVRCRRFTRCKCGSR